MTCIHSQGVIFCQLSPMGFIAVLSLLLVAGFVLGRGVQMFLRYYLKA